MCKTPSAARAAVCKYSGLRTVATLTFGALEYHCYIIMKPKLILHRRRLENPSYMLAMHLHKYKSEDCLLCVCYTRLHSCVGWSIDHAVLLSFPTRQCYYACYFKHCLYINMYIHFIVVEAVTFQCHRPPSQKEANKQIKASLSLSSFLWRPTQLYLKEGRGWWTKTLRNTLQRLRSEEFSSRDFGLRSFRRPEI